MVNKNSFRFIGLFLAIFAVSTFTLGTTPSYAQDLPECKDTPIGQAMQQKQQANLEHTQTLATGVFQPLPSVADTVCLGDQIASASQNIGGIFSDNSQFFNSVKNTVTMPATIANGVLSTLATILSGNPFSTSNITGLIGSILGFGGFDECNGMQSLFSNTVGIALPAGVLGGVGNVTTDMFGSNPFGISFGTGGAPTTSISLSNPTESKLPAEGECHTVAGLSDTVTCQAGPNTKCVAQAVSDVENGWVCRVVQ